MGEGQGVGSCGAIVVRKPSAGQRGLTKRGRDRDLHHPRPRQEGVTEGDRRQGEPERLKLIGDARGEGHGARSCKVEGLKDGTMDGATVKENCRDPF